MIAKASLVVLSLGLAHCSQPPRPLSPQVEPHPVSARVDGIQVLAEGVFLAASTKDRIEAPKTEAGSVGSLGQADPELAHAGPVVPMALGTLFGIRCVVLGAPKGSIVVMRLRMTHPPTANPATGIAATQDEWDWPINIGIPRFGGWRFEKPWELAAGDWKMQVFYGDSLMAERTFQVKP